MIGVFKGFMGGWRGMGWGKIAFRSCQSKQFIMTISETLLLVQYYEYICAYCFFSHGTNKDNFEEWICIKVM